SAGRRPSFRGRRPALSKPPCAASYSGGGQCRRGIRSGYPGRRPGTHEQGVVDVPINSEHLASLTDAHVIDENGDKVGGVGQIYLDDATGQPAWASVKSGLFGLRESFVPLAAASIVDGNIQVPYTTDHIKDAPRVDAENHLDDSQQSTLFDYYGVDRGALGGSAEAGEYAGGADRTAAFSSEETAQGLYDGRTEGLPTSDSSSNSDADFDAERDGAVTSE